MPATVLTGQYLVWFNGIPWSRFRSRGSRWSGVNGRSPVTLAGSAAPREGPRRRGGRRRARVRWRDPGRWRRHVPARIVRS
jgi:hypothetical protein